MLNKFKIFILIALQSTIIFAQNVNLDSLFKNRNVNGCIIIFDLINNLEFVSNSERCDSQFLPASTFKILNSLISLETKAIQDEKE